MKLKPDLSYYKINSICGCFLYAPDRNILNMQEEKEDSAMKAIGKNIYEARKRAGLTQMQLAERLDVSDLTTEELKEFGKSYRRLEEYFKSTKVQKYEPEKEKGEGI